MSRAAGQIEVTPARLDALRKRETQHKYDHGHALVLSGPAHRTGAARLAAEAALRVGAGLVTVGAPLDAVPVLASALTAVMVDEIPTGEGLGSKWGSDPRLNAICAGPALGLEVFQRDLVAAVLKLNRATVLDADALSLIAQDETLLRGLHGGCVLTPHAGEFRRLWPDLVGADTLDAKLAQTRSAAARSGAVVLYKGAQTVIAAPEGQVRVLDLTGARAVPWLATAGAGDVLSGLMTGLLARGLAPLDAAATGALIHAESARLIGPGLVAEDIAPAIPKLFKAWGL